MNRIVLSRKGSDATAGGCPSPVLPDGRLAMIPIPEDGSGVPAGELRVGGRPLAELAADLGIRRVRTGRGGWRALGPDTEVHADPDLDPGALPRPPGWRPLFGQSGAAQTHLSVTGRIGPGDLFLFWGWYRHTRSTSSGTSSGLGWEGPPSGFHALHGWLEVGEVVAVTPETDLPWAARHPHLVRRDRPANTVYVAARAGTFRYGEALRLTAPGSRLRSRWRVPAALHPDATGTPLTYHGDPRRWHRDGDAVELAAVHQGQEFVVPATDALVDWAWTLIDRYAVQGRHRSARG